MKDKYKNFYMMFDKRFKNLILCSNLNSDGGVEILNTMKAHVKSFIRSVAVNAIMWGLILWSFFEFIL